MPLRQIDPIVIPSGRGRPAKVAADGNTADPIAECERYERAILPTEGLSLGLSTIQAAREVLLVAFGEGKRSALAAALEGPVGTACPASVLQDHPALTVIADRAAAAGLRDGV